MQQSTEQSQVLPGHETSWYELFSCKDRFLLTLLGGLRPEYENTLVHQPLTLPAARVDARSVDRHESIPASGVLGPLEARGAHARYTRQRWRGH